MGKLNVMIGLALSGATESWRVLAMRLIFFFSRLCLLCSRFVWLVEMDGKKRTKNWRLHHLCKWMCCTNHEKVGRKLHTGTSLWCISIVQVIWTENALWKHVCFKENLSLSLLSLLCILVISSSSLDKTPWMSPRLSCIIVVSCPYLGVVLSNSFS